MSRIRRAEAQDQHARFEAWLLRGASGVLARDVTLHAAFCEDCRRAMGALDGLALIDVGRATMPPSRREPVPHRRRMPRVVRVAAAAGAVLLAAAGGAAAGSGLVPLPFGIGGPGETPVQEVLGGTGVPSPTPSTGPSSPPPG